MTTRRIVFLLVLTGIIALASAGLYRSATTESQQLPQDVATSVTKTLRCPTCQGVSIADSPAPVAAGMRKVVEEQAVSGRSPDEIRAYFVDRYGDWVLLAPPRRGVTWLLWVFPLTILLLGAVATLAFIRRNTT